MNGAATPSLQSTRALASKPSSTANGALNFGDLTVGGCASTGAAPAMQFQFVPSTSVLAVINVCNGPTITCCCELRRRRRRRSRRACRRAAAAERAAADAAAADAAAAEPSAAEPAAGSPAAEPAAGVLRGDDDAARRWRKRAARQRACAKTRAWRRSKTRRTATPPTTFTAMQTGVSRKLRPAARHQWRRRGAGVRPCQIPGESSGGPSRKARGRTAAGGRPPSAVRQRGHKQSQQAHLFLEPVNSGWLLFAGARRRVHGLQDGVRVAVAAAAAGAAASSPPAPPPPSPPPPSPPPPSPPPSPPPPLFPIEGYLCGGHYGEDDDDNGLRGSDLLPGYFYHGAPSTVSIEFCFNMARVFDEQDTGGTPFFGNGKLHDMGLMDSTGQCTDSTDPETCPAGIHGICRVAIDVAGFGPVVSRKRLDTLCQATPST